MDLKLSISCWKLPLPPLVTVVACGCWGSLKLPICKGLAIMTSLLLFVRSVIFEEFRIVGVCSSLDRVRRPPSVRIS